MKIKIQPSRKQGSVLMGVLILSFAIGFMLTAYLSLVSAQYQSVVRSRVWNTCVPIMEGGVEEGLAHLNQTFGTNLISSGWSETNSGCFKVCNVGDGTANVVILTNSTFPVVYAMANLSAPVRSMTINRSLMVETKREGLFTKGMVAKGQITLNGNNILVDSFDSADPTYSSNGVYVASRRKDNGDVATNSGLVNSLASGNANIYGHVATGPGGSVGIGANGAVGNLAWHASGVDGIQPGYFTDDMNVSFPDATLPFSGGFEPDTAPGYQYVINSSGDYRINALSGTLLIKSNVNARLIVTSEINLTGQDKVIIQPGASLNLYMAGATAKIGGNGVINQAGNATNFFYWGTPANTLLAVNGNGSFIGVIYAPQASFTMNGSGNSSLEDVTGASVTKSVQMNGDFNFHYDENLGRLNLNRGFIVISWKEM